MKFDQESYDRVMKAMNADSEYIVALSQLEHAKRVLIAAVRELTEEEYQKLRKKGYKI